MSRAACPTGASWAMTDNGINQRAIAATLDNNAKKGR